MEYNDPYSVSEDNTNLDKVVISIQSKFLFVSLEGETLDNSNLKMEILAPK